MRQNLKTLLIIVTSLDSCWCHNDPGISRVKSLISQKNFKEARAEAQRLLEDEPDNLEDKHLLAFSHAAGEGEGGDLALAVRLGLEIVTSDKVRTEQFL